MKNKALLIPLLFLFSVSTQATTVGVFLEKENFPISETVKITLVVDPYKPVGGQLVVYRKAEYKNYSMARILYTKPSPEQCLSCARDYPLSEYLNRTFLFDPNGDGEYLVEANFGGFRDSKNFTVGSVSTTTSVYTTTSSLLDTTSLTLLTSTTSSSSSTTTVAKSTTTSLSRNNGVPKNENPRQWQYALLFVGLTFLLAFILHKKSAGI
jgi:energy-coupling factor transporter transmembrane protein EcfT